MGTRQSISISGLWIMMAATGMMPRAQAGTYTVLHNFCSQPNCTDGKWLVAGVTRDSAGNLYGTTEYGGTSGWGAVYKIDTSGNETVLYNFCSLPSCADGETPHAGVISDSAGNLYGTTQFGGTLVSPTAGVVYKIDTSGKETVLYSFCSQTNCTDGNKPLAGVIRDSAGNLYGTTQYGGTSGFGGVVYKIDTSGKETVLYNFCSQPYCADGQWPYAAVIRDSVGNLYGTTYEGGASGLGVVYKIDTSGRETVLYNFCSQPDCTDGALPMSGVTLDLTGNLYGTASGGGTSCCAGVVYKIDTSGNETVLYNFCSQTNCADGSTPYAGVIRDSRGNIYGTALDGGAPAAGLVYKIDTSGKETVLHNFCRQPNCADGAGPEGGLIPDSAGNIYGTTFNGGASRGGGVVFRLTP